jgi:hypothetical protein
LENEVLTRCFIKRIGHYIATIILAAALGAAAYGCLRAYARFVLKEQLWVLQHNHLQRLTQRQVALQRKQKIMAQADLFARQVEALRLAQKNWSFYDVNVQGPFSFDTAKQIIEQCSDSDLAYFWPMSLVVKVVGKEPNKGAKPPAAADHGDVQINVTGQFIARQ